MARSTSSHSTTTATVVHSPSEGGGVISIGREQHRNGAFVTSIWDSRYADERKALVKAFLTVMILTTTFMFLTLPIYWGTYFRQEENLFRLSIGLVDLDTPAATALSLTSIVGPALIAAADASSATPFHLGWTVLNNEQFDISEGTGGVKRGVDVHRFAFDAVLNEDYYAIIIANANATTSLYSTFNSLSGGTPPALYTGADSLSVYYAESRNFDTVDQWVGPGMTSLLQEVVALASPALVKQLSPRLGALSTNQLRAINSTLLASVLASPFGFTEFNIRPLDHFAGIAATTIGNIYLLIFTYYVSLFWNAARAVVQDKIRTKDLVLLRVGVPVIQYFFISLSISLISLAFAVPANNFYGRGGFVIFWLSNFLTQWALGMPMEIALSLLGPLMTAFFLIFWVITNVSVAFIDLADADHFYSYGFIMPVFQAVDASKSVLFGTKNHLGQNFGINLAWAILGSLMLAYVVNCQRNQQYKRAARSKEQ